MVTVTVICVQAHVQRLAKFLTLPFPAVHLHSLALDSLLFFFFGLNAVQDAGHLQSPVGWDVCHTRRFFWLRLVITCYRLGRMGALFVGVMLGGM
jgi:hypothetical protein